MSLSFRCGQCKEICVVGDEMVGKTVRCPNGHLLTVPPGLTPIQTPPTASPPPLPKTAGASKNSKALQPRKTQQEESIPTARTKGRRAEPEEFASPRGRSPALVAVVVLGLLVVLLGGLGLGAWALFPGDSAKPALPPELADTTRPQRPVVPPKGDSSNVELVAPAKLTSDEGAAFSVQVLVRNPTAGLTVSVELPEGLELVGGNARQEVPTSGAERAITWSVRGTSVGSRSLTLRASNGSERQMLVDIRKKGAVDAQFGRTFDRLDRTKFDIQLPALVANAPTPALWDGHTNHIRCVSFTNDGEFVISVSGDTNRDIRRPADNSIRVWDARQGKQVHKVEGFAEALDSLSISPGGRFALCSFGGYWKDDKFIRTTDHGVFMWDIQAKKAIGPDVDLGTDPTGGRLDKPKPRFSGLGDMVFATDTSPDNETVLAGDGAGGMILWDTKTGERRNKFEVTPIRGSIRGNRSAKFAPDGQHLIVVNADYTLRMHETKTGREVAPPLSNHLDTVWALALYQKKAGALLALSGGGSRQKADGTGFEPGARDYAIRLWDLNKKAVVRRFTGHEEDVSSLAFCPNGRQCVSGSLDKTVRLWDLESGKQLRLLGRHDGGVNSVAVSPNGRSCVSGGSDCKVHFGQIPTGQDIVEALAKKDLVALRKAADDMDVIGPDAGVAFAELLKCLGPDQGQFRKPAAKILTQLARSSGDAGLPFDSSHIGDLRKMLEAANPPEVVVVAVLGLGTIGPAASEAVPALLKHFEGKDAEVAAASAEALGKIGVKSAEVVAALQKGMEREEFAVRKQSLLTLQRLDPEKITVSLLLGRLEKDDSPEIQAVAEKGLREKFPSLTRKDVPALREGLKTRPARVCVCCADAVAALRADGVESIPDLTPLLKRSELEVIRAALRALTAFGDEGRPAAPELVKLMQGEGNRKVLPDAITTLQRIDPDNEAIVKIGIPLLIVSMKPQTPAEMNTILANPLGREENRVLATLGKSVVQPLADELKSWAPTEKKNQDVSATLVRYQIYKLLGELADKAATDKGLQAALKGRLNALKTTYVPKETFMVQKAIKARLNQMESAPYVGANAALRETIDKISALRAAKP